MSKTPSETRRPMRGPGAGHGPGAMMMSGEKAKDFKGTFKKLIHYMSRYKISMIIVFFFAIASTIFSILGPKILGKVTTSLFTGLMNQITGTGKGIDFGYIGNIMYYYLKET